MIWVLQNCIYRSVACGMQLDMLAFWCSFSSGISESRLFNFDLQSCGNGCLMLLVQKCWKVCGKYWSFTYSETRCFIPTAITVLLCAGGSHRWWSFSWDEVFMVMKNGTWSNFAWWDQLEDV